MKAQDYKWIARWGKMMGSYQYYIKAEQAKAEQMNAPAGAIFERDGVWSVIEDVDNPGARHYLSSRYDDCPWKEQGR